MTDTSKPELLPCPFCGGEAEKPKSASLKGRPVWETGCKSMFCVAMSRNSKKRLVEDWNTRAAKDAVIAELGSTAAQDVLAERQRQKDVEGWTPERDDTHTGGQMAGAAACYALTGVAHWACGAAIDTFWPWDKSWWKPTNPRRDLVKAAALLLAEIERLDRLSLAKQGGSDG